jgi:hypothetical protein
LGLVGAGRWGKVFINTLAGMEGVRLAGLASSNPQSRSLVPPDCRVMPEWRDLIQMKNLAGLIVATPPHTHAEITLAAIRAGLPVLVEKPLTLDPQEGGTGERIEIELLFSGARKASIELSNLMDSKCRYLAVDCATETLIYDDVADDPLIVRQKPASAAHIIPVPPIAPVTVAVGEFAQAIAAQSHDLSGLRLAVDVVSVLERCERSLKIQ